MPELRVEHVAPLTGGTTAVGADQRRRGRGEDGHQRRDGEQPPPGAEELAVALDGRQHLSARFEQDSDGQPLVRVVDRERGETVALLTPEELRRLAEQTGLPTGMLVHLSS
ncbi:MAG: hypothetical protein AB7G21_01600 [Dehalococcoidia bacterium]